MLLHRLKTYKFTSLILLFFISSCITQKVVIAKAEDNFILHQDLTNLFSTAPKENKYLLDGWNNYIIKTLGYSNAEHLMVINELSMDYAEAVKAFNKKYEKDSKIDENKYSSKWIDELVDRFGKAFICANEKVVMMNLLMATNRKDNKKYDQAAKDVLGKELILYLAYQEYLSVFMQYYNQLDEQDQKKMKAWKKVAENYLSVTSKSHFATIYYGMHMKDKIRDNAVKKENNELYMFFERMDLPFGSGVTNKAERDIDMFYQTCKVQGLEHPSDHQAVRRH